MNVLKRFEPQILAVSRMVFGSLFMMHGVQKLLGWFGGAPAEMPVALLYLSGTIELMKPTGQT